MSYELKVCAATANCGNSTLGISACRELFNLLSKSDGPDLLIINCQEVSLQATLDELRESCPVDTNFGIMASELRVTRTKIDPHVIMGKTGISTIVIYNKSKIADAKFELEAMNNTHVGKNKNKGGHINHLIITDREKHTFKINTVSAHLESNRDDERMLDWRGVKSAVACSSDSWEQLVQETPHLQVAGYDANTRNLWHEIDGHGDMINMWHQQQLDARIAPLFLAPLGEHLYSANDTYKFSIDEKTGRPIKTVKADKNRPGYANAGSLDFVAVQNNTDDKTFDTQPKDKRYFDAAKNLIIETGTDRDHNVIVSDLIALQEASDFNRVRHAIAAQLLYAAPTLSRQVLKLSDTPEHRNQLLKIYRDYLGPDGKLIHAIQFEPHDSNVKPYFNEDSMTYRALNWVSLNNLSMNIKNIFGVKEKYKDAYQQVDTAFKEYYCSNIRSRFISLIEALNQLSTSTNDPKKIEVIDVFRKILIMFHNDQVFNKNGATLSAANTLTSAKSSTDSVDSASPLMSDVSLSPISVGPINPFKERYQDVVDTLENSPTRPEESAVSPDNQDPPATKP